MPPELAKARKILDRAVDAVYGRTTFRSEAERVAFLFERYWELTAKLDFEYAKPAKSRLRR